MRTEITPILPLPELVTLQEAKDWMVIEFDDFDGLIGLLIKSAIQQAEKTTGKMFYPKEIKVFNDCSKDKYPVKPILEYSDDANANPYTYKSGYTAETFPSDLKVAILQDVATGFSYRQNGVQEAVNATVNASIYTFRSHIESPMI